MYAHSKRPFDPANHRIDLADTIVSLRNPRLRSGEPQDLDFNELRMAVHVELDVQRTDARTIIESAVSEGLLESTSNVNGSTLRVSGERLESFLSGGF